MNEESLKQNEKSDILREVTSVDPSVITVTFFVCEPVTDPKTKSEPSSVCLHFPTLSWNKMCYILS